MDCQDWEPVTVTRKETTKERAAKHKPVSHEVAIQRRIENDEPVKVKTISNDTKQLIILKRLENKWNQQQLNTQCAFPANVIRDIEAGRAQPTPHQLSVLSRILKVVIKYDS
jgi:ribosome-binding protein aMBF1 (putative translation factor)